ncbi:MAG TPA: Tic20 family protein [Xenococcaceae cyanobacterium]
MAWRGTTDIKDRIFAALVYSLPLYYSLSFGQFVISYLPRPLAVLIEIFLTPLTILYGLFPFADFIIFFALFLLVVRNEKIRHFIRFNTMQALLIDIALVLLNLGLSILPLSLVTSVLSSVIFMATLAVCIYSVVQCSLGKYPEIPSISEAVYSQVP